MGGYAARLALVNRFQRVSAIASTHSRADAAGPAPWSSTKMDLDAACRIALLGVFSVAYRLPRASSHSSEEITTQNRMVL